MIFHNSHIHTYADNRILIIPRKTNDLRGSEFHHMMELTMDFLEIPAACPLPVTG